MDVCQGDSLEVATKKAAKKPTPVKTKSAKKKSTTKQVAAYRSRGQQWPRLFHPGGDHVAIYVQAKAD